MNFEPHSTLLHLVKLIGFNTVSHPVLEKDHNNRPLMEYVSTYLLEQGFNLLTMNLPNGKQNVFAFSPRINLGRLKGEDVKATENGDLGLLLSGHSDTVPFKESEWNFHPLDVIIDDGKAYGRGTVDMKGFIASSLHTAYEAKLIAHKTGTFPLVSLLITADEETSMLGAEIVGALKTDEAEIRDDLKKDVAATGFTVTLAENKRIEPCDLADVRKFFQDESFKLIMIGEATSMQAVTSHKGWKPLELHIQGKSCHSSNPDLGVSAVVLGMRAVSELQDLAARLRDKYFDEKNVSYPTLNIGTIKAGTAINCVCDNMTIGFDIRTTPLFDNNNANKVLASFIELMNNEAVNILNAEPVRSSRSVNSKEEIQQLTIANVKKLSPIFQIKEPYAPNPSFINNDEESLAIVKEFAEGPFASVNYCTEASFLQTLGPCVVMGPGNIEQAHTVDEFISLDELKKCDNVLLKLLAKF